MPMHCSANHNDECESAVFLAFQELARPLFQQTSHVHLLEMMSTAGMRMVFLTLREAVTQKQFAFQRSRSQRSTRQLSVLGLYWKM